MEDDGVRDMWTHGLLTNQTNKREDIGSTKSVTRAVMVFKTQHRWDFRKTIALLVLFWQIKNDTELVFTLKSLNSIVFCVSKCAEISF